MNLFREMSKWCTATSILIVITCLAHAQPVKKTEKKYPSLLWEITGKGMKRPSYLFGTMHVSNKMVFNLGDSFYHAIQHSDYIGLELDPGYWQEYFSRNARGNMGNANPFESLERRFRQTAGSSSLTKKMFAFTPYEKKIERAITLEPTIINSLLYRKSQYGQEYEEDTYLDMYLYQICKKLNKQIVGLEVMETSEKMSKQAMLALQEGRGRTRYDDEEDRSTMNAEDAYKTGDLDMLDSIDRRETPIPKFRSIFIDQRNEIQANSIDSIIRLGHSIFAGVGAAHLPGINGVIEELRRKGYKMRPVKLQNRNSLEKERIDRIHYPVQFTTRYTADSVIKADIPGEWYRFRTGGNLVQYSDLANGSYYLLTRVPTDALFWGHNDAEVLRKIDSMLYENIPGKILTKTSITNNGYKGFEITNRTRRGDRQRYQIFATPFEVVIAKMSGTGDYVATGTEAGTFFNSIRIRPLEKGTPLTYAPAWGAFSVQLPHQPYISNRISGNTLQPYRYEATDPHSGILYAVLKETRQRSNVLEEDTFELKLLGESYASSKMVEKETGHRFITQNGFPALEATYQLKDKQYSMVRYVLQGPHYYAIIAQQKDKPFAAPPEALTSFRIQPFRYGTARLQTDSIFGFSFQSPVPMNTGADDAADLAMLTTALPEKMNSMAELFRNFFSLVLSHDSTGESIGITGIKFSKYTSLPDSMSTAKVLEMNADGDFTVRRTLAGTQNGWTTNEAWFGDTASSRMLHVKTWYREGIMAGIRHYTDTLTSQSAFADAVFSSFKPADSLRGSNPYESKSPLFFSEYASRDSAARARALENISGIRFRKEDLPQLKQYLSALNWTQPHYLGTKKRLLTALGDIREKEATDYLKTLYTQANDTSLFQQQILNSLLNQRTLAAFKTFETLITDNPPVELSNGNDLDDINDNAGILARMMNRVGGIALDGYGDDDRKGWDQLTDTMQLTQKILPGLLNLMSLDDYKEKMEELVLAMADSGYAPADLLQPFYTKFLLEAKQAYKKASVLENENAIKKKTAELKKKESDEEEDRQGGYYGYRRSRYNSSNEGHQELYDKLIVLMPFYNKQQSVRDIVQRSFGLKDEEHLYKLMKLMIRKDVKAYPDTLIRHFAAASDYRSRLYAFLYDQNKLSLFPATYHQPLELAQARFHTDNISASDTMAYVGMRPFELRGTTGTVYFFKYKPKKAENWKWGMTQMSLSRKQAGEWDLDEDQLDDATSRKLNTEKTLDEQMDTLLKEKLNSRRVAAYDFYEDDNNQQGRYGLLRAGGSYEED